MYSKKGKRKIIINNKTYYWCVTTDKELGNCGLAPVRLQVFSDNEYLFGILFEFENKRWDSYALPPELVLKYDYDIANPSCRTLHCDAPKITPRIVKEHIISYLKEQG